MNDCRLVVLLAAISLAGCGGEEPYFEEEGEEGELDTNVQAVTSIDNCATGAAPNALFDFPLDGADQYIRPRNRSNPGGPCGSNPRRATYVELTTTPGHVVHISANARFVGTPNGFCGANSLVFKVEKWSGGEFVQFHEETVTGYWQGSNCNAAAYLGVYPPDATGRYRVRAVAPRFDGLVEEVRIWADDQQD